MVGSILLAWKTMSVEVEDTAGGIDISILLFETVLVAVEEATTALLEIMGAWLTQEPVLVVYPLLVLVALSSSVLISL